MKIEFEIPDLKFNVEDIVEIKNTENDKSIFVRVESYEISGNWIHSDKHTTVRENKHCFYNTTVQLNSYYNTSDIELIRPGKIICFSIERLEKFKKVNWDLQVTTPDTIENIDRREKEWLKSKLEI